MLRAHRALTLLSVTLLLGACAAPTTPSVAPTTPPAPAAASAPQATAAPQATTAAAAQPQPAATAPPAATSAASGQTLSIASLANLSKTLHPFPDAASYTQSWIDTSILIWGGGDGAGGLLAFDWDSLDYKPAMAADMPKVSDDGKTYTFTLRNDLKWSDGSPITVDDFQFAWDNASKKENDFVNLDQLEEITSFTTPDQNTIQITLNEPKARDVALGTVNSIGPIPKKVWEGKPWNDASANPEILNPSVVLGPYKVQEFKIAERGSFVPVSTYPAGQPKIPQVEILPGQQPTVAYEALKSGRANYAPNIPPAQYQEAKSNPDLNMVEWTAANASYRALEFNTARPFLSDQRVREALSRAVSRDDILDVAEGGLATPQYSFIQPTNTKWVNSNVEHYDFDMDRARQLLLDAGYQMQGGQLIGNDGQPVKLEVLYPTSSAPRAKIGTYLQQQYKQLGIDVDVKGLDFNAFTDQVNDKKDFDISLATYGGGSLDPELGPRAQLITGGQQNVTGFSNPQVDELFKQGASEMDETKRKQIYDQIQQIVNQDIPSHYLYALKAFSPVSKKVQGVVAHKGDRLDYNDALLQWSVAQ
ncbi:MAG: ABC transporter substrate-binding protein [Chloroflexi bacterium]|nr:ABC transporter substrate-binding protein [Chloroflexota bacterium]